MDTEMYTEYFSFFLKHITVKTAFDNRSYKSLDKIPSYNRLKLKFSSNLALSDFQSDFCRIIESFNKEIIIENSNCTDINGIDSIYFVLKNCATETSKLPKFSESQLSIINQTINNMEGRHSYLKDTSTTNNNVTPTNSSSEQQQINNAILLQLQQMNQFLQQQQTQFKQLMHNKQTDYSNNDSGFSSQQSAHPISSDNNTANSLTKTFEQTHSLRLKNQYIKKIKFLSHQKTADTLIENGKFFPTFNANNFFTPFLPHNKKYKEKFIDWLKKIQTEGMQMVKESVEEELEELEEKIKAIIEECNDPYKQVKAKDLYTKCEEQSKKFLETAHSKTQKVLNTDPRYTLNYTGNISESWFVESKIRQNDIIEINNNNNNNGNNANGNNNNGNNGNNKHNNSNNNSRKSNNNKNFNNNNYRNNRNNFNDNNNNNNNSVENKQNINNFNARNNTNNNYSNQHNQHNQHRNQQNSYHKNRSQRPPYKGRSSSLDSAPQNYNRNNSGHSFGNYNLDHNRNMNNYNRNFNDDYYSSNSPRNHSRVRNF
jgi:hypothetical protein